MTDTTVPDASAALAAEKAAQAAAKAAEKEAAAAAKAAQKAEKEAAAAAKKAEKEAAKAAAKAAPKEKQPEQNGITRPRADNVCGNLWAMYDDLFTATGAVPTMQVAIATASQLNINEHTIRTQYARWRKFNNHPAAGRVKDEAKEAEKAAAKAAKAAEKEAAKALKAAEKEAKAAAKAAEKAAKEAAAKAAAAVPPAPPAPPVAE